MIQTNIRVAAALLLCAGCASTGETRRFAAHNDFEVQVPDGARRVEAWFALPADDEPLQDVYDLTYEVTPAAAGRLEEVRDGRGNRFLHLAAEGVAGQTLAVRTSFTVERREARHSTDPAATRAPTDAERAELAPYLEPSANIEVTPDVQRIADEVVNGETNPVVQARRIYDWVLENVTYWVKHPDTMKASGIGSSRYCLSEGCGNCTDFHSLYAAIARAAGLPVRMVYGSFFKGPLAGMDKDQSYHCWIEFWAPKLGWTPLDVAVADVFVDDFVLDDDNRTPVALTVADGYAGPDPALVEYYFGNLDARRVTWNRGRDLTLPGATAGPVNAMPKAWIEVDGRPLDSGWTRKLTFEEL